MRSFQILYRCIFILRQEKRKNFPYLFKTWKVVTKKICLGPCLKVPSPCFAGVSCRNLDYGNYQCGDCPPGYEGNGTDCVDIDEVGK